MEYTLTRRPERRGAPLPGERVGLVNHGISHRNRVSDAGARALKEHAERHGDLPVSHVQKFRRDWMVLKSADVVPSKVVSAKRGEITEFSSESRYRLLHLAKNCNADFRSMLTITYPASFPRDGAQVKRELDTFKKWLRREIDGIKGLWFLEFQRRGAPHFHFLLDLNLADQGELIEKRRGGVRRGERSDRYQTCQLCEDRASAAWFRIVGSGDEKHLRAGVCWELLEDEEAALRYAAKHAAKPKQKTVPEEFRHVGRFWGKIGELRLVVGDRVEMTTEEICARFGADAISARGRIKKYLWDAECPAD